MSSISTGNAEQYGDSRKLAARARLHTEYMIAEIGWFPWVARQLPFASGDRILDIGCGPGWFWATVAKDLPAGLDLTLADQSAGMVEEALQRCGALGFETVAGRRADASALPFEDGSFDLVIAMHMLYHLPDPAKGIAEMHRVLRPGGVLAVTTNGAGNMQALYELTTALGSPPADPSVTAFGYDAAERIMQARFGDVVMSEHPARLRITEPEDVFLALTSYPPGDRADQTQIEAFRDAIAAAFRAGGDVLDVEKKASLFVSRKIS